MAVSRAEPSTLGGPRRCFGAYRLAAASDKN